MTAAILLVHALGLAQLMLGLAMLLCCWRLLRGPRAQDRVLGLDALYASGMLMLLVTGIRTGSVHYVEAALVIAGMGFVSTVALGKFLLRGEVIE